MKTTNLNDLDEGEHLAKLYLSQQLNELSPFLSKRVVDRLKVRSLANDSCQQKETEIVPIKQPESISGATLRDYQIRGVSIAEFVCSQAIS